MSKGQRDHVLGSSSSSSVSRVHRPVVGLVQADTQVGLPFPELTGPSRKEEWVSPSMGDPRLLNQEAHALGKPNDPHEALVVQIVTGTDASLVEESPAPPVMAGATRLHVSESATNPVGRSVVTISPAKGTEENRGSFSDGLHAGDPLATLDRTDLAFLHTTRTNMLSTPPTELMGSITETSAEAKCLFSVGFSAEEPQITPGKAETEVDRALEGLMLSNFILNPLRAGIEEVVAPDDVEGGWVEGDYDPQGIDSPYQSNQPVLALTEVDEGLEVVDCSSPLKTFNPMGLVVSAKLNSNTEGMRLENTLNVSNWVKHRLPGFSKMMGLSLGRHEKRCIMLLQRLEKETKAANLVHRNAAHRKAVSKVKGKRELRNLISSVNYEGR